MVSTKLKFIFAMMLFGTIVHFGFLSITYPLPEEAPNVEEMISDSNPEKILTHDVIEVLGAPVKEPKARKPKTKQTKSDNKTPSVPKTGNNKNEENPDKESSTTSGADSEMFCKMPKLDPNSPVVTPFIGKSKLHKECPKSTHSIKEGKYIKILDKVDCKKINWQSTVRQTDKQNKYSQPIDVRPGEKIEIKDEIIKVTCEEDKNSKVDVYYNVLRDSAIVSRSKNHVTEERWNILLFGLDSMSRSNAIRSLKNTREFLENQTSSIFIDLEGMNINADGTTGNLAAILTGKVEETLPEARKRMKGAKNVDVWPWIFQEMKDKGYVTSFSEDNTQIGAFNLRLMGFKRPPADIYTRNFFLENDKTDPICIRNSYNFEEQMNIGLDFFKTYSDIPKFGFFFNKYAHDDFNLANSYDEPLKKFYTDLEKEGVLENTFVILFADHGSRFGKLRNTTIGKYEERMPMYWILVPKSFAVTYPGEVNNLKNNQNKLSTHFDIHATLRHILNLPDEPHGLEAYQQSLLKPISDSRDCNSAKIAAQWCACSNWVDESKDSEVVLKGSNATIEHLNKLLEEDGEGRCKEIALDEIIWVKKLQVPKTLLNFVKSSDPDGRNAVFVDNTQQVTTYQFQYKIKPFGTLESSFTYYEKEDKFTIEKDLSRIDLYGNLPCDPKPHLRQFCHCK